MKALVLDDSDGSGACLEKDRNRREKLIAILTSETEQLHPELSTNLADFCNCTHVPTASFSCSPCRQIL